MADALSAGSLAERPLDSGSCRWSAQVTNGWSGSLCKGLHSDPYAQVATMRRWVPAPLGDAGPASTLRAWGNIFASGRDCSAPDAGVLSTGPCESQVDVGMKSRGYIVDVSSCTLPQ